MADSPSPSLIPPEDYLLERKTKGDLKDLLKTMVAFANSVRSGHVATILIGERDDGTAEGLTATEADNIQKRVRETAEQIYPPIIWRSAGYVIEGKQCIRIEIEFSGDTPHFGGPAWVRRGSESVRANDSEFQRLIDIRTSIVRDLEQWVGKRITFELITELRTTIPYRALFAAEVVTVNRHYITLAYNDSKASMPLKDVAISWDDHHDRLQVIMHTQRMSGHVDNPAPA